MKKKKVAKILWLIYLKACMCQVDCCNTCSCEAYNQAAEALRKMYGPDWHEIVRKKGLL